MKTIMIIWLMFEGRPIPESFVGARFPTMEACVAKGDAIKLMFDGKKTLTTAEYVCEVAGTDA